MSIIHKRRALKRAALAGASTKESVSMAPGIRPAPVPGTRISYYTFRETFPNSLPGNNTFPEVIEPGVVYFCMEYGISVHLCPCGCKEKVFLPFKKQHEPGSFWGLQNNTFTPSIQKNYGCKSHYFIKAGKVTWA